MNPARLTNACSRTRQSRAADAERYAVRPCDSHDE
jgi:hypothetical protein